MNPQSGNMKMMKGLKNCVLHNHGEVITVAVVFTS